MPAATARSSDEWNLCERYDWRSWLSWRALFGSSAIMGLMCGMAALVAESVVRDLLGMELGGGLLAGPDLLAFALVLCVMGPGFWLWIRVLKTTGDGTADRPDSPPKRLGVKHQLLDVSLYLCWFFAALAVYLVLYYEFIRNPADVSGLRVSSIIVPASLVMGFPFIHAGLKRFGAKPGPITQ